MVADIFQEDSWKVEMQRGHVWLCSSYRILSNSSGPRPNYRAASKTSILRPKQRFDAFVSCSKE